MPNVSLSELKEIILDQGKAFHDLKKTLRQLHEKVDTLSTDVARLQPRSYLPPLRRPTQGIDFSRNFNVAAFIDAKTKDENKDRIGAKYLEFESNVAHETLNSDAMRCLEGLFDTYLSTVYGTCTWNAACKKQKVSCEKVIREASAMSELAVFAQGSYWWPIRELAKQKFKSRLRANRHSRTSSRTERQVHTRPADTVRACSREEAIDGSLLSRGQVEQVEQFETGQAGVLFQNHEKSLMNSNRTLDTNQQDVLGRTPTHEQPAGDNQENHYHRLFETGFGPYRENEAILQAQAASEKCLQNRLTAAQAEEHMTDVGDVSYSSRAVQTSDGVAVMRSGALTAIVTYESSKNSDDVPVAQLLDRSQFESPDAGNVQVVSSSASYGAKAGFTDARHGDANIEMPEYENGNRSVMQTGGRNRNRGSVNIRLAVSRGRGRDGRRGRRALGKVSTGPVRTGQTQSGTRNETRGRLSVLRQAGNQVRS